MYFMAERGLLFYSLERLRRLILWSFFPVLVFSLLLFFFGFPERLIGFVEERVLFGYPLFIFSFEEAFVLKLKLSFLGGMLLSSPLFFYQLYTISPLRNHKKTVATIILPFLFLFVSGVVFGYYVLLPTMLTFFLEETLSIAEPQMALSSAVIFVVFTLLVFGISFEFPLIASLLAKLHILSHKTLLAYWRHAMVLIVVWAGFITPDVSPISQSVVALPMIGLYFVSIGLAKIFY